MVDEKITIVKTIDDNPKELNLESIQKNTRFAKLMNQLIFEVYDQKLGYNDDNTKLGVIDVYPLNNHTNWSILNYFGGHKFVKRILLEIFNSEHPEQKTPRQFYNWMITNKKRIFCEGPILRELIRTNMATFNKGCITENYVIDKLKTKNLNIKYYPPGSTYDRDHGVDLEINGKLFQIKELTGVSKENGKLYLSTPLPKNYLNKMVNRIMLVNINNGEFISFENKNYTINLEKKCYVLDIENKTIKEGLL